jgi:hypothetical protein
MREFFEQVEAAGEGRLYYIALMAALAVPDICAAMESDDGQATGTRYRAWFDRHVAPRYGSQLTGEDCYRFRCSMLHQGGAQHPASDYSRIVFIEPGATTNVFHNNVMNDALKLDVRLFCRDMAEAGLAWLPAAEQTENYTRNYPRFVQRYPDGPAPYIVGVPVIS